MKENRRGFNSRQDSIQLRLIFFFKCHNNVYLNFFFISYILASR